MLNFCKTRVPLIGGDTHVVATNLHRILDYPDPIPAEVIRRAAEDREYLHQLILHRKSSEDIRRIFEQASSGPESRSGASRSSPLMLLPRFLKSVVRWLLSGGRRTDRETQERRLDACSRCPRLTSPTSGRMRRAIRVLSSDQKVCELCGCSVSCKAKMATESCPDVHPLDPTRTRWGDPIREV